MTTRLFVTALVAIGLVGAIPLLDQAATKTNSSVIPASAPAGAQPAESTPFERVERGMTYMDCVGLFGLEGYLMQAVGPAGLEMQFYRWYDSEQYEIYISFIDGRVEGKQRHDPGNTSRYSFSGVFGRNSTEQTGVGTKGGVSAPGSRR